MSQFELQSPVAEDYSNYLTCNKFFSVFYLYI